MKSSVVMTRFITFLLFLNLTGAINGQTDNIHGGTTV